MTPTFPTSGDFTIAQDHLYRSLLLFSPELTLALTIPILLICYFLGGAFRKGYLWVGLMGTLAALGFAVMDGWPKLENIQNFYQDRIAGSNVILGTNVLNNLIFSDMIVIDPLAIILRWFILLSLAFILLLNILTRFPQKEASGDYTILLLGSTLGMMIMASANHLLMMFLGMEMATVPCYMLAAFRRTERKAGEAGLKYVLFGSAVSGLTLYGITLVIAQFGSGYLPDIARAYFFWINEDKVPMLPSIGLFLIVLGLFFKLSIIPFHFWCPDVFEGCSAEIAGFLSVASKGAALGLLIRFLFALADPNYTYVNRVLATTLGIFLGTSGVITSTFGNLLALRQTNLQRIFAYSTIAHAGYLLLPLSCISTEGVATSLFYLIAYLWMNLGVFACIAIIFQHQKTAELARLKGYFQRAPFLVTAMVISILSLLGLPPLIGFAGKFQIFSVLLSSANQSKSYFPFMQDYLWILIIFTGGGQANSK